MDMVKQKRFARVWWGVLAPLALALPAWAEAPQDGAQGYTQPQPQQPVNINPQPAAGSNGIKIWDDRVFDLSGGTAEPETRTSVGGSRRYLDKTKELDYNTEQRARWMASCASLKDSNFKAYGECVETQKKKELGSRTNFGTREGASASEGISKPSSAPAGMQGIRPQTDAAPSESEAE
jgi:hypothetical protein